MVLVAALSMCFSTVAGMRESVASAGARDEGSPRGNSGEGMTSQVTPGGPGEMPALSSQNSNGTMAPEKKTPSAYKKMMKKLDDYWVVDVDLIIKQVRAEEIFNKTWTVPCEEKWNKAGEKKWEELMCTAEGDEKSLKDLYDKLRENRKTHFEKYWSKNLGAKFATVGIATVATAVVTTNALGNMVNEKDWSEKYFADMYTVLVFCSISIFACFFLMAKYLMAGANIQGRQKYIGYGFTLAAAGCAITGLMLAPAGIDATRETMNEITKTLADGTVETRDVHMEDLILNPLDPKMATSVLFAIAFLCVVLFLVTIHYGKNRNEGEGLNVSIVSVFGGLCLVGTAGMSTHIMTKMSISDLSADGTPWAMTIILFVLSANGFGVLAYKALGGMEVDAADRKKNLKTLYGTALAVITAATFTGGCFEILLNGMGEFSWILFAVSGLCAVGVFTMIVARKTCYKELFNQRG